MSSFAHSAVLALALSAGLVAAQAPAAPPPQATYPAVALAKKGPYAYPDGIPYKVDTDLNLIRGTQHGYNICNGTTAGQTSLCQTSWLNSLEDFCLWAPPDYGREVGDIEGIMVAWCTKPTHGARLIPAGALYGVQYTKTPDYVQVVGFIDQTKINMLPGDYGGEMDPHGADLRGNPMGGLVYTDKFTGNPIQGIEWHNFMGSNQFCFKVCDPAGPSAADYCEHIHDRIGCAFNAPNAARNGTFESCDGESQDFPGVYTDAAGAVKTYTQPALSLGPITSMPYVARVPQSSNCKEFASTSIYAGLPTPTGASSAASITPTSGAGAPSAGGSKPSGNAPSNSGSNTAPGAAPTGGAGALSISLVAIAGSVFAGLFFA